MGINGEAAAAIVMTENPRVTAITVEEGAIVTADFRCDRVRVYVNQQGLVSSVPGIG